MNNLTLARNLNIYIYIYHFTIKDAKNLNKVNTARTISCKKIIILYLLTLNYELLQNM